MSADRLDELERQLRESIGRALRNAVLRDPAWPRFEATLGIRADIQNGMSSPPVPEPPLGRDEADPAAGG